MTRRWAAFPARAPRSGARCSTPTLLHARSLESLVAFVAAVLAGVVGLLGAVSASAASAESTYDIAAYTYNASASLSGPHAATTHACGSPGSVEPRTGVALTRSLAPWLPQTLESGPLPSART